MFRVLLNKSIADPGRQTCRSRFPLVVRYVSLAVLSLTSNIASTQPPLTTQSSHSPDKDPTHVLSPEHTFAYIEPRQSTEPITDGVVINCNIQSDIYELSTRHLSDRFCSINEETPNLEVCRWGSCRWNASSLSEALQGDDKLTIVYVHGNFMERENARERVRIIDAYLKRQAKETYRLLQFSWPSEKQRPILRDAADNAKVAEMESLYLAWILKQLQSQSRVSILGFSYGARTVTGALHLDAGGSIPGLSFMPPDARRSIPYRLGLIAPAVDKKWLTSSGRYSSALSQVDGFVNLYNSRDPVLRRFRFIDTVTRPIAGGLNGFDGLYDPRSVSPLAGGDADNVRQFDCGAIIGTTHSEKSYLGKCPYFRVLLDNLLWNPSHNDPACSSCIVK
ncbi:MAG: alpha/beta hydrolase [Pirellula sp.]|nr:alpha/beta hydrolase [Pirellula sp.]